MNRWVIEADIERLKRAFEQATSGNERADIVEQTIILRARLDAINPLGRPMFMTRRFTKDGVGK